MTSEQIGGSAKAKAEDVSEMLAVIGALIIAMQTTERVISAGLSLAFPHSGKHSLETLTKEAEANKRATIGALVKKLQKRVEIADDFAEVLAAFLQARNDLVHDVSRIPGFGWQTEGEILQARVFLETLVANTETVTKVFIALLAEWSAQIGFHEGEDMIRHYLGDKYGIASSVFFAKPKS